MKWLCIIFLLLNVSYLGWEIDKQTRIEVNNSMRPFTIPANVDRLELLSEYKKKSVLKTISSSSISNKNENITELHKDSDELSASFPLSNNIEPIIEQSDVVTKQKVIKQLITSLPELYTSYNQNPKNENMWCMSFGPFVDIHQVNVLNQWLKENNLQTKQRTEDDEEEQYFWIYLSPNELQNKTTTVMENLRAHGVKDYQLINKGNLKNAISLGLFSSQLTVNKRLNEIQKIGYQPIIVPYYKKESVIWLDAKIDDNKTEVLSTLVNDYPSRFNSIPVKCENIFTT